MEVQFGLIKSVVDDIYTGSEADFTRRSVLPPGGGGVSRSEAGWEL